jgi:FtsH-binding integral membrane protein
MRRWSLIGVIVSAFIVGVVWAAVTDPTFQLAILKDPSFYAVLGAFTLFAVAVYYSVRALLRLFEFVGAIPGFVKPTQAEMQTLSRFSALPAVSERTAVESAQSDETTATKVRIHVMRVTCNLSGSFALAATAAALTSRLIPQSLAQGMVMRLAIIAVPLLLCFMISRRVQFYRDVLAGAAATKMMRSLLAGYAALVGFASATAFTAQPLFSAARIFLVVALAFAAASLWGYGMRRELPDKLETLIVSLITMMSGCAIAFLVEIIAWPEGIEDFKYSFGMRTTIPDPATSGGYEWVGSFFASTYFAMALGSYSATVRGGSDIKVAPSLVGGMRSPWLMLLFLITLPLGGYKPFIPSRDKLLESPFGALGALAVLSRILLPLAVTMALVLLN